MVLLRLVHGGCNAVRESCPMDGLSSMLSYRHADEGKKTDMLKSIYQCGRCTCAKCGKRSECVCALANAASACVH